GSAGDKSFAEFLQSDRVDGVEGDPGIVLQKEDEAGGGLFQANGHFGGGMLLTQFGQPVVQGFGGGGDGLLVCLARGGVKEMKIGLAIGTIQADDQVKGV